MPNDSQKKRPRHMLLRAVSVGAGMTLLGTMGCGGNVTKGAGTVAEDAGPDAHRACGSGVCGTIAAEGGPVGLVAAEGGFHGTTIEDGGSQDGFRVSMGTSIADGGGGTTTEDGGPIGLGPADGGFHGTTVVDAGPIGDSVDAAGPG